ncbi:unnamed protein product [Bursaphelenchus okinawaensis]|uniref:DNA ligase IV n=1 Tax=Bursaphelenchus okinawaensis TaxID=465554 RepID=A0A811KG47_9BILA|nr:unnamed protein product [Bursaphelenchus okinawaensis]CAG9103800.1 unnamed protein product [Bursaphelenchus okinawaensis]
MSDSEDVFDGIDDNDDIKNNFTFQSFCFYLEKHKNLDLEAFSGLVHQYKQNSPSSIYNLIRLFLPAQDKRTFYLTSRSLKKVLNSVITTKITDYNPSAEVFADALYQEYHGQESSDTLAKVNKFLDVLESRRSQRGQIFQKIGKNMNKLQLTYLFHIILCDMAEFVTGKKNGTTIILSYVSVVAKQLLSAGFDLRSICDGLEVEGTNEKKLASCLILGKPIRPMLLSRLSSSNESLLKVIRHCGRPFYVETKFDGEHFIVHRIDSENYMYYSRKGNDYTENFGPDMNSGFSARIHKLFKDNVVDCVLDCEFVIWDVQKRAIVGKNRRTSEGRVLDVKYLDDNKSFQRCLVVFDVLMYNGKGLMHTYLEKRLEVLNKNIFKNEVQGTLLISQPKEITKVSDFFDFYKSHMEGGEEGVVVKGKQTWYKFGQRAIVNGWFKVKPDYGVRLTLDLACVGVRYEDVKHTKIKAFVIAASTGDGQLRVVGGVQSSLRKSEFEQLIQSLDLRASGTTTRPYWIPGVSQDKTIKYANVDNVQVVEVKASGLINGRLQFPVITSLRNDKFVDEINFYSDVMSYETDLRERKRRNSGDEFVLSKAKKKRIVPGTLNASTVESCYNDIKVYVVDDFRDSKRVTALKGALKNFGFFISENYTESVMFVVSMSQNSRKCQKLMQIGGLNIIKASWVDKCVNSSQVIAWNDDDYLMKATNSRYVLEESKGFVDEKIEVDDSIGVCNSGYNAGSPSFTEGITTEFEDVDYTEELDAAGELETRYEEIEQMLEGKAEDGEEGHGDLPETSLSTHDDILKMDEMTLHDYPGLDDGYVFQDLNFYMPFKDENVRNMIEDNGGNVLKNLNKSVTHITFTQKYDFKNDPLKLLPFLNVKMYQCVLTDVNWVQEAIQEKERYKVSLAIVELSA